MFIDGGAVHVPDIVLPTCLSLQEVSVHLQSFSHEGCGNSLREEPNTRLLGGTSSNRHGCYTMAVIAALVGSGGAAATAAVVDVLVLPRGCDHNMLSKLFRKSSTSRERIKMRSQAAKVRTMPRVELARLQFSE